MRRNVVIFGVLTVVLFVLVWVLIDDKHTTSRSEQIAREATSEAPQSASKSASKNAIDSRAVQTPPPAPRFEALPMPRVEESESEKLAQGGLSVPQRAYPEKPEPPEFDMPSGQEIMPFTYQRLLFKNAPNDKRMGLALYVTLKDPENRKLAFLHRRYLHQLTSFLASKYDYSVVQSDAGKQRFIDMLEVRFKRKVKGGLIQSLDSAYFDAETEE